jgi:Ca-activated chloride channel family protein
MDTGGGDQALREIWLRQVQTRPADFLRSKFAYQYATRAAGGAE